MHHRLSTEDIPGCKAAFKDVCMQQLQGIEDEIQDLVKEVSDASIKQQNAAFLENKVALMVKAGNKIHETNDIIKTASSLISKKPADGKSSLPCA